MTHQLLSKTSFFSQEIIDCPYPTYEILREAAPVWKDPATGMFFVSRYEDIRSISLDQERFSSAIYGGADIADRAGESEAIALQGDAATEAQELLALYEENGWVPAPNLLSRDEPDHMELRRLFEPSFRPAAVKTLEPFIETTAFSLVEKFLDDGQCEWVSGIAVRLPLFVIGKIVGVPEEDLPWIKAATDLWIQRIGLTLTPEHTRRSIEMEIEVQHYLHSLFEKLRGEPNDTLFSVIVNGEVPEWGRALTENELQTEAFAEMLVGGHETITSALASGAYILAENKDIWEHLKADPETSIEAFCEELLRIESPVQGLLRRAKVDVELHGVTIPAGSTVHLRYGAGNRDPRRFECPETIDLRREKLRTHLAFGVGGHHCLGAPIARRELYHAFKALVDSVDDLWLLEDQPTPRYNPNYFIRSLRGVRLGFTRTAG